jgi:hypothetical protein
MLEAVGAAVAILGARIAAELRARLPMPALVELEVGAAHRAMEVIGSGGCGCGCGLRSGGLRGLHGWMVLSFYYFSLPYPLANFFFNFFKF